MAEPAFLDKPDGSATRERILRSAETFFFTFGFSRVSMAEIAADLGMSKKTLYQHFPGKEALLRAVADRFFAEVQAGVDAIVADDRLDFPAKVGRFLAFLSGKVARIQSPAIQDIKRGSPHVWHYIEERRRETIHGRFGGLLRAGIAAGMVRPDLHPHLVVRLLLSAIERLGSPETLAELAVTPPEVFHTVTTVIFEGILTDEARGRVGSRQ